MSSNSIIGAVSAVAITFLALSASWNAASAGVTPEEAAKLGAELTPTGGERAGNADGTIPEWKPGLYTAPDGFKSGVSDVYDPFSDEKPLFKVTSGNLAEYKDKLSTGVLALFETYPEDFYINVYKTHRTHELPDWIYENTAKNALTGSIEGKYPVNVFGGIPFPIPKSGIEVVSNHLMRYMGGSAEAAVSDYFVSTDGNIQLTNGGVVWVTQNHAGGYYEQGGKYFPDVEIWRSGLLTTAPAYAAGGEFLAQNPMQTARSPNRVWQYLQGQRRLRKAPQVAFDTPASIAPAVYTWDQVFGLLTGSPEKYDWKLVGKKEMYVPYNEYKFMQKNPAELLGPKVLDPEAQRWELHRVWVVEATLAPGQRHRAPKRTYYIDEDSWVVLLLDEYDSSGQLWKVGIIHPAQILNEKWMYSLASSLYNLANQSYGTNYLHSQAKGAGPKTRDFPADWGTPERVSSAGIR